MKRLGLIVSVLLLVSCGSPVVITRADNVDKNYRVESIESRTDVLCRYNVSTGADYINYDDNLCFDDSIGKFKIGDVITLEPKLLNK